MGLVSIVAALMAIVGFITFGFTQTVCSNNGIRIKGGHADSASLVINGYDYDFSKFEHPAVPGYFNGTTNPLYSDVWQAGGKDASFLFQNVNENCLNVITPASGSAISNDGTRLGWYFPCNLHDQNGTSPVNKTGYADATNCHTSPTARSDFYAIKPVGEVYYTWDQVRNTSRNLAVYES
jgi:chitin synthase